MNPISEDNHTLYDDDDDDELPTPTNMTSYIIDLKTMIKEYYFRTSQKQVLEICWSMWNAHYAHLFLSSRISLFLAWSSAMIGPPAIPPPCVTTIIHKAFLLQILKMFEELSIRDFQSSCFWTVNKLIKNVIVIYLFICIGSALSKMTRNKYSIL